MSNRWDREREADEATSLTLIDKVKQANPQAWDRFVDLYGPLIFHWCIRSGLSRSDAEDLGQEVFMRVSNSIAAFEKQSPEDTLRGWLRVITQRKVIDFYRKRARVPEYVGLENSIEHTAIDSDATPSEHDLDEEQRILYQRAMDLLHRDFSESTIHAFMLSVVEGLPAATVAEQLGISLNSVYIAKSRVLNRLRTDLADA